MNATKIYRNILVAIVALIGAACTSSKTELPYFKNIANSDDGVVTSSQYDIRVTCDDELAITVTSSNPEATAAFNLPLLNTAARGSVVKSRVDQQQTYIVDSKGDILFPVLGAIHVEGLTLAEITDRLTRMIEATVADPVVHVELLNFKVSVIGEVKEPGIIEVGDRRYSVLDAIAEAGDLTQYGRRDNVLIIREENGVKKYHRLDLNRTDILTSPYFYLHQNDVVYVEPNEVKVEQSKYSINDSYKLRVVSTIVRTCSVIASLVIALSVK